jgi:hypothetical protein
MEIEGYEQERVKKNEKAIDITVSKPDSDETVLMHIVTNSDRSSDTIGADKARKIKQLVDKEDVDKLIVFGQKFTKAAGRALNEEDIDLFSNERAVLSVIPPIKLYSTIYDYVNQLCTLKCGAMPKSASECSGYSEDPIICSSCEGSGKIDGRTLPCKTCKGLGFKNYHYPCKVRLISDNADYHQKRGWITLLQNDLSSLIKIMRRKGNNGESTIEGEVK